ncbi:pectinesterase family protein, partial [Vibrio vulnificus]
MKGGSGFSPTKESLIFRLVARCITFETRPGTRKARAVALRSASDLSVLYKCESLS